MVLPQESPRKDVFLTLRVPNPTIEDEAKILLETLESSLSFDTARLFYQDDIPPIFEVILPMTSSAISLDRIYRYYRDFVVGKQNISFRKGDVSLAEWIGTFEPASINVIPLFEDLKNMLQADAITREYLKDKEVEYQRVFLARSDPAMNYGQVSAILMNKMALHRLQLLEEERPSGPSILGWLGTSGNLKPDNVEHIMSEYPRQTTSNQRSFDNLSIAMRALPPSTTVRSKVKEVDD